MVTPKGSLSTEGETLQVSVPPYRCSICPPLVTRQTSNPVIKFLSQKCNVCGRNLITGLKSAPSPRVDISSTCKVGQKLGVSLPLLACFPSAWPSRLLYRRGRNSRRDLRITLYSSRFHALFQGNSRVCFMVLFVLPHDLTVGVYKSFKNCLMTRFYDVCVSLGSVIKQSARLLRYFAVMDSTDINSNFNSNSEIYIPVIVSCY